MNCLTYGCEDALNDAAYFAAVYKEAVQLTAYLCKLYQIDPHGAVKVNGVNVPTILCHQDSYRLGFGSNHGDVLHWFSRFGKTMDDVRRDVAALLDEDAAQNETPVHYQVTVTAAEGLNCRATYSASGRIVTVYPKGAVLTVLKECNGWGFVGAGWISLAYTARADTEEDDDMDEDSYEQWLANWERFRKEQQAKPGSESWGQEDREWAKQVGLFKGGTGDDGYMWQDFVTREQLATVVHRDDQRTGRA